MTRRLVVATAMALSLAGSAFAEPFFVEMRDGTFKRCGNLKYAEANKRWTLRGCPAIAGLFSITPEPSPHLTSRPTPRPTEDDPCPGGCMVWNPVTDSVSCKKPCPE